MIRYSFDAEAQGMPLGEYCLYSEAIVRERILEDLMDVCRALELDGVNIPQKILEIYYKAENLLCEVEENRDLDTEPSGPDNNWDH